MDSDQERVRSVVTSLVAAPGLNLYRINGIGTTMLGALSDPALSPARFAIVWSTAFYVTVWPHGIVLVQDLPDGKFKLFGRLPLADFNRLYPRKIWSLVAWSVIQSVLTMVAIAVAVVAAGYLAYAVAGLIPWNHRR